MRPISLVALSILYVPAIQAQSATPGSGPYFGAGIELMGFRDGSVVTPGRALQVGYSFAPHGSALSLRIEGGRFDRRRAGPGRSSHAQVTSLNFTVAYRLGWGRTQPYLIGGAGLNALRGNSASGNVFEGQLSTSSIERTSGSALAGLGLQRQVLGVWLFTEVRYTVFTHGQGFGTHIMPLTLGVRF